jgi:hypothetical protein
MDAFTEARQTLGKAVAKLMQKHDTSTHMSVGRYHFYAKGNGGADQHYVFEMGWKKDSGLGVFALRKKWNGWEDAVSDSTTIEDLQECLKYMPVAEKLMEIEDVDGSI